MVQIALVRPGSTDYDIQGRIQGNLDIPLNEMGRKQAASAVECLRGRSLTAIYSSAGQAAEETAELIGAALKLKPKTLERLENMDHGLWQGMLIDDVKGVPLKNRSSSSETLRSSLFTPATSGR